MARRIIVIGAGWAGCSAAAALARRGARVALFDLSRRLGGRASSRELTGRGLAIDNGQHLFLGAYRHARALLGWLGTASDVEFQPRLAVPFLLPEGRIHTLRAMSLPGPLALASGVSGFALLDGIERRQALAFGLWAGPQLAALAVGMRPATMEGLSARAWLSRCGQGPGVTAKLWEPLGLAACNANLDQADAGLFGTVLARGFLRGGRQAGLGFSRIPLGELLAPLPGLLAAGGGEWHPQSAVAALEFEHGMPVRALGRDGRRHAADAFILALPARQAAALLPAGLPEGLGLGPAMALPASPIVSVYLLTPAPLLPLAFGAFVGTDGGQPDFHWAFDKGTVPGGQLSCFVASAAGGLAGMPRTTLLQCLYMQLERWLPGFKRGQVLAAMPVVEQAATPLFSPGTAGQRPAQRTAVPGLALAGDWTDTGLPGTIEGAVLSGFRAADAVA